MPVTAWDGDFPAPRGSTALEVAHEAWRVAWRADQHGVDLHASVISHLAKTDAKVDELDRHVREVLRELRDVRERTPSAHDLEEAAGQVTAAAEAVEEAVEELKTSPGMERPPTPSDRVRRTVALDEHARWVKMRDTVVGSVAGGLILAGIFELVRYLSAHH